MLHLLGCFFDTCKKIDNNIDIQNILSRFLKIILLTFNFFGVTRSRKLCRWVTTCHKNEKYKGESKTCPVTDASFPIVCHNHNQYHFQLSTSVRNADCK